MARPFRRLWWKRSEQEWHGPPARLSMIENFSTSDSNRGVPVNWKLLLTTTLLAAIQVTGTAWGTHKSGPPEQSTFSMEDASLQRPVSVPEGALAILRKDKHVLQYLEAEGKSAAELTAESFLASEIHLDGPEEVDLVVIGRGRLLGANIAPFWVFRRLAHRYKLVLHVFAHDLSVENTRHNGLKEITAGRATAGTGVVSLYRFEDSRYRLSQAKSERIP